MIKKLTLNDFQAHHASTLQFDPGVNAIIGASDSGKSSVLRGLRWGIENKGSGEAFKSHWSDDVSVTIETTDPNIITRKRDKKQNEYIINGESLKAFGQAVPEEIKNAFRMQDVNIQSQLDAPFLLSFTPGEAARYLNEITGLNKIDTSLAKIQSTGKELRRAVSTAETDVEEAQGIVESFKWLPGAFTKLEKAKVIQKGIQEIQEQSDSIFDLYDALNILNYNLVEVPDCDMEFAVAQEIEQELGSIQGQEGIIYAILERLRGLPEKSIPNLLQNFQKVEQIIPIIQEAEMSTTALMEMIREMKKATLAVDAIFADVEELKKEMEKVKPAICPTCGKEWE